MLRNRPRLSYCGLTLVLSNPSRFDSCNLLTGPAGHVMGMFCLRPEFNQMMCDVRLADDKSPWLPNTKCILLCGEYAMHAWLPETRNNTLNEMRGSVFDINGIPATASYFPQDCADPKGYEQGLNPLSKEFVEDNDYEDDETDEDASVLKTHSKTKRANYAFWLRADTRKCKQILAGYDHRTSAVQPVYKTYPPSDDAVSVLTNTKGQHLYFDIETDYEEQNMQCFSFSFDGQTIYNVPVLDYNYKPAYSNLHKIFRALAVAIRDNTLVAHNGANFDFFVLGYKYRIPVYKVYDTMIAQHRCFPDIEKSLGHCVSLWTWERFHKDEDSKGYMTHDQMMARMKYCGKDVWTMYLVHQAIEKYARTIPGLQHSIATAQSHIVPYLITTLQGIRCNEQKIKDIMSENDRLMMQYLRLISLLIGDKGMDDVRHAVKGKAKAFANSNTQTVEYFHHLLGYSVVAKSPDTGKPSLGKKAMFNLALKHNNPVIQLCLAYRILAKESGALKFLPFKDNNNKVVNWKQLENDKNSAQPISIGQV